MTRSASISDLSVVIVNWNSGPYLDELLASLLVSRSPIRTTLVVDNASQHFDNQLAEKYPQVTFWRQPKNLGFAGAANRGIERTQTPFVLLLNPDVQLLSGSLSELHRAALQRSRAGIICGPLLGEKQVHQKQFQLRPLPDWKNILMDVAFGVELIGTRNSNEQQLDLAGESVQVEQPAAAYWLLRREAWEDIGGFDPDFFPAWFEDVDFCKRLASRGWQIWFSPDSPALHRGGLALERLGYRKFVRIYYGNLRKYLRKHHPHWYPWLWLPIQCGVWIRISMIGLWRR